MRISEKYNVNLITFEDLDNRALENEIIDYLRTVIISDDIDKWRCCKLKNKEVLIRIEKRNEGYDCTAYIVEQMQHIIPMLQQYEKEVVKYRKILDSIDDGIFALDSNGDIIYANKAVEKSGGITRNELIGNNIIKLIDEGYCSESITKLIIGDGQEHTIMQKVNDGTELLVTGIPCYDDSGKIEMIITCERDITELIQLKKEVTLEKKKNEKYRKELQYLRAETSKTEEIVAQSDEIKKTISLLDKVSKVDTTVLIQGESGVGKEVFAKYIYNNSSRKGKPFIKINCGAIPETLIESELFGYMGGAYTGSKKEGKAGYFELANGGVLFLDEISEIPYNLQVKLLRAIQEKEIIRVGGINTVPLDIRIIAATNRNLKEMVNSGTFRKDLYYRLSVIEVNIAPLRKRRDDIEALSQHFIKKYNTKYNMQKMLSTDAIEILKNYDWPGNVRELENMIERILITTSGDIICGSEIRQYFFEDDNIINSPDRTKLKLSDVKAYEKELLIQLMRKYENNTAKVATELNITRSTVNRKLKKLRIR